MAEIYGIQNDGTLQWYRHDGSADGSFAWTGPNKVGDGWQSFKSVFAGGDGIIYGIQNDGALQWYRHDGRANGTYVWTGPNKVGDGWQSFKSVFSGGDGAIYAIQNDGVLQWYRHDGRADGTYAWTGPNKVGDGWQSFNSVFSGSDGIIYGIQNDGTLQWYRHDGRANGTYAWTGPNIVGKGWQNFNSVFSGGDGIIYGIQNDGTLQWYRHDGRADGTFAWTGPNIVGKGWQNFKLVIDNPGQSSTAPSSGKWHSDVSFKDNTPLGGWVDFVADNTGAFTFSGHMHNSGFDPISFTVAIAIITPLGMTYGFGFSGRCGGTISGGSRDCDWMGTPTSSFKDLNGNLIPNPNPAIASNWNQVAQAKMACTVTAQDLTAQGVLDFVTQSVEDLAKQAAAAGTVALIGLLAA